MKKIMILGASILQLPAILKAKEMGLQVIAVDMDKNAIGFKHADICLEISTIDTPKVVEAAKKYKIDAVMTLASDMPMRTVAAIAAELDIVGISEETALKTTNKALMRECLYENNVPVPRYYKVNDKAEYDTVINKFDGCIVKPVDNSGSRGVYLIKDTNEKKQANDAYVRANKFSRCGDIIVEEYMKGPEVSVEVICFKGSIHIIQITDKITTGAPFFVEMGHIQPSQLPIITKRIIKNVTSQVVRAIGLENGCAHVEIIVTDEGPKVVEVGARLGGDCITTHLVPLSTGVDMVECAIKVAIGEKPDTEIKLNKGSAIRYLDTNAGVINSIFGIEEAKNVVGVSFIEILASPGDEIKNIESSNDRIGFVITQGNSPEEASNISKESLNKIVVTMF